VYAVLTTYYPDEASYLAQAPGSGTSGPLTTPRSKYSSVNRYPPLGTWIIAYQDVDTPARPLLGPVSDGLAYAWDWNCGFNFDVYALPHPTTGLRQPGEAFTIRYGGTTLEDIQAHTFDWTVMRGIIPDPSARNLGICGHGSPSTMGGDYDRFPLGANDEQVPDAVTDPRGNSQITCGEVQSSLGFWSPRPNHYYRFVFLEGCRTALGFWPQSFGMKKKVISSENDFDRYYKDRLGYFRRRPSAFCGWTQDKALAFMGVLEGYAEYRKLFRDGWLSLDPVQTLREAHERAAFGADAAHPPGSGKPSWGAGLAIYGCEGLRFNEYNTDNL
jgi:hypothetical protein